jgi:hypothetical protein
MIVAKMEEEDRKRTESFSKKQGRSFNDQNIMSEKEIDEFIQDIKAAMDL